MSGPTSSFDADDRATALVLARYTCGQHDVVFEHRRHDASALAYAPFDHHLISIHTGDPITLEHTVDGRSQSARMRPGSVVLIPAGRATSWRSNDTAEFLNLQISPAFFERIAAQAGGLASDQCELADTVAALDSRLNFLGQLLATESHARTPNGSLYADSLATAVAVHLLRNYTHTTPTQTTTAGKQCTTQLRRVVAYIHDHSMHDIRLAELAELAGLSPNYLVTQFHQLTGLPPHQYLLKVRVARAQQLLARGNRSISEVATAVGFLDQSHLTRHMRRLSGITPAAFRRQQRKNVPEIP